MARSRLGENGRCVAPPRDSPGRFGHRGEAAPPAVVEESQSNARRSCYQRSFRPQLKILGWFPVANRKRYSMLCTPLDPLVVLSPRCGHHPSRRIGPREAAGYRLRIRRHLEQRDFDRYRYFPGIQWQTAPSEASSPSRFRIASPLWSRPIFAIFSCLRNVLFWIPPAP